MPQAVSTWRTAVRACWAEARSAGSSVRMASSAPAGLPGSAPREGGRSVMALIPSGLGVLPVQLS
jgi:hypothetical protein